MTRECAEFHNTFGSFGHLKSKRWHKYINARLRTRIGLREPIKQSTKKKTIVKWVASARASGWNSVWWNPHLVRHAIEHLFAAQLVAQETPDPLGQVPRGKEVVPMLVNREPPLDLKQQEELTGQVHHREASAADDVREPTWFVT